MNRAWHFEIAEPLSILGILGGVFSLGAWLLTIGTAPLNYRVASPAKELAVSVDLPAASGGLHRVGRRCHPEVHNRRSVEGCRHPHRQAGLFCDHSSMDDASMFRLYPSRPGPISLRRRDMRPFFGMLLLVLGFQAVFGRGLRDIVQAHLPAATLAIGFPIAFVWLALEAGIVEEFFFRALLQSRLSRALRSELGGIVLMSLLFGLAHAPGLYLRAGLTQEGLLAHPPLLMAVGY